MYILQEIQTTNGNSALVPAQTFDSKQSAESAFHTALAAAAVSNVTVHAVVLLDEHGNVVRREFYEHLPEVAE